MKIKQPKLRPQSLVNDWWEIELRRRNEDATFLVVCLHHRKQVDREVLRKAHKENPLISLGDLLKKLTKDRSLVVRVDGDPYDADLKRIEQDDFGLDTFDIAPIAAAIYRRLATELLPLESSTNTVIDIRTWFRQFCYASTAARVERTLRRHTSSSVSTS